MGNGAMMGTMTVVGALRLPAKLGKLNERLCLKLGAYNVAA